MAPFATIRDSRNSCFQVMIIFLYFCFCISAGADTCSCAENEKYEEIFKRIEMAVYKITNKQLKELQLAKDILLQSSECPSTVYSNLKNVEEQIVKIHYVFSGLGLDHENGMMNETESCGSDIETFCSRISNMAENNHRSIAKLNTQWEIFQKEKEDKLSFIEKNYQQKVGALEVSLEQMETKFTERNIHLSKELENIKVASKKAEKMLIERISQLDKSASSKECICPSTDEEMKEIKQLIQDSKVTQEKAEHYLNESKENCGAIEGKFEDRYKKFEKGLKITDQNIRSTHRKLSSLKKSVKYMNRTISTKMSLLESSIATKNCSCISENSKHGDTSQNAKHDEFSVSLNEEDKSPDESKRFFLIDKPFTWDEAENACRRFRGRLATIPDEATQRFLENVFRPTTQSGAWLGLKSNGRKDGLFQWNSGMKIYTKDKGKGFQNWHPLNPADYLKGAVCGRMIRENDFGQWADDVCEMKQGALCEAPK